MPPLQVLVDTPVNIRRYLIAKNISLKMYPPDKNNPNLMYDIF